MREVKIYFFSFFIIVLCIFIYINRDSQEDIKKLDLDIYRFEQSLFETDSSKINQDVNIWKKELGSFFERFNFEILKIPSHSADYQKELIRFVSNSDMRESYDSLLEAYPNLDFLKNELGESFGRYKYFFPNNKVPRILTYFSGFNYGVVSNDTILAIGLDYFLGENSTFYKRLGTPSYLNFQKQKKFILPNCMEVWANKEFARYNQGNDFLSMMLFKGKLMYFIDVMLPDMNNANKLRFSNAQLQWCNNNEKKIWSHFISNDILFSTDFKKYRSYISYSPLAKGMPKESPGRIAYWLGWKIVDAYMEKIPSTSIDELMRKTNSQQILQNSGYKP